MKRIILVLGVVALLAAAGVSFGVANAKPGGQELKVVALVTEVSPGGSRTLEKGETLYAELVLYGEGDAGGLAIGEGNAMLMATFDVGVAGTMGLFVYEITGKGEIHVSAGPGKGSDPGGRIGTIIGGTGFYRGVTGEYHHEGPAAGELNITFKFNSGRN